MELKNTTVLPTDDLAQAEQLFKSLMSDSETICAIIFGDDSVSQQAVQSANVRAAVSPAGFKRRAVWMSDIDQWASLKKHVNDGNITVDSVDPKNLIALGTSLKAKAESSVDTSKTPDFITMELVFADASKA